MFDHDFEFDSIRNSQSHCPKCGFHQARDHDCNLLNEETCIVCSSGFLKPLFPLVKLRCGHLIHLQCKIKSGLNCPLCKKKMVDNTDFLT